MTPLLGTLGFDSMRSDDSVATGRFGDLRGTDAVSQRSLLESAMQQVGDGVAVAKCGDGGSLPTLVYFNRSFSFMVDFPSDAMPENPLTLLAASNANSPLLSCLADALTDRSLLSGEIVLGDAAEGKRRHIDWRATQLRNAVGSITHAIGVYRDITIQRQREESLLRMERLASLGAMTAAIAHEVNNPLGAATIAADTALATADCPQQGSILSAELGDRGPIARSLRTNRQNAVAVRSRRTE